MVLIAAFPATFAYWRVGPASIGMSVADALTFLGALAALPYVPWRSPTLRRVVVATAGYCGILFVTVVAHMSERALVEVFHRASIVIGAVLIGAAVARLGRVRLALRAFLGCGPRSCRFWPPPSTRWPRHSPAAGVSVRQSRRTRPASSSSWASSSCCASRAASD